LNPIKCLKNYYPATCSINLDTNSAWLGVEPRPRVGPGLWLSPEPRW